MHALEWEPTSDVINDEALSGRRPKREKGPLDVWIRVYAPLRARYSCKCPICDFTTWLIPLAFTVYIWIEEAYVCADA